MKRLEFWVVGGDERQAILAGLLAGDGHRVHTYALEGRLCCRDTWEGIGDADCVILPLPVLDKKGSLNTPLSARTLEAAALLDRLSPGQQVLAGAVTPEFAALARARGLALTDYFARDELALLNAIPTAEGAIRVAMEQLPITLHGARVLLLGFGRLGQTLAPRLRALGARVHVAARRAEQRALAATLNLSPEPVPGPEDGLCRYDLVINTIPAQVLGVEELAALKEGVLVIDLASRPGGVDDESAAMLGVRVIHALSLPGREAPLTAGHYLRDTIYHILESEVGQWSS